MKGRTVAKHEPRVCYGLYPQTAGEIFRSRSWAGVLVCPRIDRGKGIVHLPRHFQMKFGRIISARNLATIWRPKLQNGRQPCETTQYVQSQKPLQHINFSQVTKRPNTAKPPLVMRRSPVRVRSLAPEEPPAGGSSHFIFLARTIQCNLPGAGCPRRWCSAQRIKNPYDCRRQSYLNLRTERNLYFRLRRKCRRVRSLAPEEPPTGGSFFMLKKSKDGFIRPWIKNSCVRMSEPANLPVDCIQSM